MSEGFGNDEHSVSIGLKSKPSFSLQSAKSFPESKMDSNFVSSSTRNNAAILESILHGTETITDGILFCDKSTRDVRHRETFPETT